jgi:3-oxoacyl-[acyl-carrier-protein] synthase II
MNIAVVGAGWITASGFGSLADGQEFSMPSQGALPELQRELASDQPCKHWRRLDDYCKAGLITASLALKDVDTIAPKDPEKTAVIVSSATGSAQVDRNYFNTVLPQEGLLASPNLFAYTLPSCMLGEVSIYYGFTGPAMVINQTTPDMMNGIIGGIKFLSYGLCEQVVAGYCNIDDNMGLVETECKPGVVFLVIQKTNERSSLTLNGQNLLYDDCGIVDIVDLMGKITGKQ